MDLVLLPNGPAAWGRKATGHTDDQDQNPCHNGKDLVDQQLIFVMRFPAGERVHYRFKSQSIPCRPPLASGGFSQALALSISTGVVDIMVSSLKMKRCANEVSLDYLSVFDSMRCDGS